MHSMMQTIQADLARLGSNEEQAEYRRPKSPVLAMASINQRFSKSRVWSRSQQVDTLITSTIAAAGLAGRTCKFGYRRG